MGKRLEGLQRMLVIVNKLKGSNSGIPVEELERYVTLRMEERGYTGVNLRTLHLRERVRHIYEAALRRNA